MRFYYKIASLIALMAVTLFAGGCQIAQQGHRAASSKTIEENPHALATALAYFSQGLISQIHKDYSAALTNFMYAIEYDPDNEELYFRVAMGLIHQQRKEEAVATMETLCERKPKSAKALLWMALIYRSANKLEQSEVAYKRLIRMQPEQPANYIQLASLLMKQLREEEAVGILKSAISTVDDPVDTLHALGDIYLRDGVRSLQGEAHSDRRTAVIDVYHQLLTHRPEDLIILNKLGELYILNDQLSMAIRCYERIEAQHPEDLGIKKKLAESFLIVGDDEKAVEVLERIAHQEPTNHLVYFYLGELYQQLEDKERAILNFRLAAKAAKDDASAYLKLGLLYLDEDPDQAINALLDGLHNLPNEPKLSEMLGYIYLNKKNFEQSSIYFEKVLTLIQSEVDSVRELTPNFYLNYAISSQQIGNFEKASTYLSHAVNDNKAFLDAFVQFAFGQEDKQSKQNAVEVLELVAKQYEDVPELYYYLGMLNNFLKHYKDAIRAFEQSELLFDNEENSVNLLNDQFYFWYAAACERDGQISRAEAFFYKSIDINSEHAEAYNYLAYMWAEKGIRLDEALDFVNKALSIVPESGAFVDTLGWIYFQQERYEEAFSEIEKAAKLIPDDPTIMEHLGDTLLKLGELEKAVPQWKQAFMLDPENKQVAQKLNEHGVDLLSLKHEAARMQSFKNGTTSELSPHTGSNKAVLELETTEPVTDIP